MLGSTALSTVKMHTQLLGIYNIFYEYVFTASRRTLATLWSRLGYLDNTEYTTNDRRRYRISVVRKSDRVVDGSIGEPRPFPLLFASGFGPLSHEESTVARVGGYSGYIFCFITMFGFRHCPS